MAFGIETVLQLQLLVAPDHHLAVHDDDGGGDEERNQESGDVADPPEQGVGVGDLIAQLVAKPDELCEAAMVYASSS